MRILLNGVPMLGRRTGIGQYGLRLLHELGALPPEEGIEEIGIFDGRDILPIERFLPATSKPTTSAHKPIWKQVARRIVPRCRQWAESWRRHRLNRQTGRTAWSLFHETNYIAPELSLPLVTTVHDMAFRRHPEFLPQDRLDWLNTRIASVLARSRVVLADSHFTRNELLELCPQVKSEQVTVAHLGVDLEYYTDPAHDARLPELRRRHGLPPRFVLFLGTLEPRKNLQGLLEAYRRLPERIQAEYPLVLAGMAGWNQQFFRPALDDLRRRGAVLEIGYVDQCDVPALLKAASVFCFPSFYEGFGLPPLEAAACGAPVLCSRAASLPEVMGDAAEYVDPGQPDDIARGLAALLDDDARREQLRIAGPARAALFSWKDCARQTLAAYRAAA